MNKYLVTLGAFALAVAIALWVIGIRKAQAPGSQACTMEAKICPDGSAVGRTGPNCEFTPCPDAAATSTLAIGESATINGTTIGVLELVEDSRCPVDVQCIQAGTVRVLASVDAYNKDFTFTLSKSQVVGNATITLASVTPAQKYAKQTLKPSDYRFTFTVVPKVSTTPDGGKACTMEAKLCPDGSYVGRTGPNCEFTPCPTESTSGVNGTISLGPTCPVMRDPPDPQCADKPYATAITVYRAGSNTPFMLGNSDATGAFKFSLPPGSYTLKATGGTMLPRCNPVDVTVTANTYATANISCDTGIR
ncbi:MAG: hypothetical protein WCS97_00870 [Candidatus Paceibacterota bacterium]|jgi:hypothetical protein